MVEVLDLASCEFRAMGTDVHVLVLDGSDDDLHWACEEVQRLEALWSRFETASEVSRINRGAGSFVPVSPETLELVEAAARAWVATAGSFDPLLGGELAALGYDRTFDDVDRDQAGGPIVLSGRATERHAEDIDVDHRSGAVRIAAGSCLDLGGIAKGWTADRLVDKLRGRGAAGACANIGGDLAVVGRAPHPAGWAIEVDHDASIESPRVLMVAAGGVATSTTLRRAWRGRDGDQRHHLLDPRTGRPCAGPAVEVTVLAGSAAQAEVLSKIAFVAPEGFSAAVEAAAATAFVTLADGATIDIRGRTDAG